MGMNTGFDDGEWGEQQQYNPYVDNQPTINSGDGWNQGLIDKTEPNTGPYQPTEAEKTPNLHDKVIFNGGEGHIYELPEWDEDPDNMLYGIRKMDGAEVFLSLQDIMDWGEDPNYVPDEGGSGSEEEYEEKPPLVIDKDGEEIKLGLNLLNVDDEKNDEENEKDTSEKKSIKMDL